MIGAPHITYKTLKSVGKWMNFSAVPVVYIDRLRGSKCLNDDNSSTIFQRCLSSTLRLLSQAFFRNRATTPKLFLKESSENRSNNKGSIQRNVPQVNLDCSNATFPKCNYTCGSHSIHMNQMKNSPKMIVHNICSTNNSKSRDWRFAQVETFDASQYYCIESPKFTSWYEYNSSQYKDNRSTTKRSKGGYGFCR